METRIATIPKLFAELISILPAEEAQEDDQLHMIWIFLRQISSIFLGANPLGIKSIEDVHICVNALKGSARRYGLHSG